jgi:hypothetical protein
MVFFLINKSPYTLLRIFWKYELYTLLRIFWKYGYNFTLKLLKLKKKEIIDKFC